jgi:hypothetical protein
MCSRFGGICSGPALDEVRRGHRDVYRNLEIHIKDFSLIGSLMMQSVVLVFHLQCIDLRESVMRNPGFLLIMHVDSNGRGNDSGNKASLGVGKSWGPKMKQKGRKIPPG